MDYKYTCQLGLTEMDTYVQYPDLHELYNKQKQEERIELGLIDNKESDFKLVPGLNVVCGMTGHGKSMLGNSIAYRAVNEGLNVVYVSLEITKENIFYQMLSIKSFLEGRTESEYISHSTIKERKLTLQQEEYVFDKLWPDFKNMPGKLHILSETEFDTTSTAALQQKLFVINDLCLKENGRGIDLLIIDYIQLFKSFKSEEPVGTGEYNVLMRWVGEFHKMSLNFLGTNRQIPIVLLSQLNRDAWSDEKAKYKAIAKNNSYMKANEEYMPGGGKYKRVTVPDVILGISQIAGCSEIAKSASQVITIYSDESLKASEQCHIQVLKNRDGLTQMEPIISYMNPKYYWVGKIPNVNTEYECNMSLSDILGSNDIVPLSLDNLNHSDSMLM